MRESTSRKYAIVTEGTRPANTDDRPQMPRHGLAEAGRTDVTCEHALALASTTAKRQGKPIAAIFI